MRQSSVVQGQWGRLHNIPVVRRLSAMHTFRFTLQLVRCRSHMVTMAAVDRMTCPRGGYKTSRHTGLSLTEPNKSSPTARKSCSSLAAGQFAHKSVEEMRWEHSQMLAEDQRWVAEHLDEEEAKAPTEAQALEWLTPQGPLLPAPAPGEVPSDLLIWARQHLAESIQWIAQFSQDQLDRDKAAR